MANDLFGYAKELVNYLSNYGERKKNNSESKQKVEDFLKEYQSGSSSGGGAPTLPDLPKFDKIDYKPPSDEELGDYASGMLEHENTTGRENIEKQIAEYEKELSKNKELASSYKEEAQSGIDTAYAGAKKNADNDALKRGIARSSIAAAVGGELEKERADKTSKLSTAVLKQIGDIDAELNSLSTKREKAISDFNLSQAAKLTEKVNQLKKEREQKITDALKYNNSISEKEHEAIVDKIMKESDLKSEYLNQIQKEQDVDIEKINDKKYRATYDKMREILGGMDSGSAREAVINDPTFKGYLNDYYYYLLHNEYAK